MNQLIEKDSSNTSNPTAPTPGGGGIFSSTTILETSIGLFWATATYDITPPEFLEYKIVRSSIPTINTVAESDAAPDIVQDWTPNISNTNATGLTAETSYYFNILVRDGDNNIALYTMIQQSTSAVMTAYEAFFRFNDLTDNSGNGHNLWNNGAVAAQNRDGTANSAYNFAANHLRAQTTTELNFSNELTISAWIRSTDVNVDQKIAGKTNLTVNLGYLFGVQNSRLKVEIWDSTSTKIDYNDGSQPLANGVWHHVAMTWNTGGFFRTYVDGVLDKEVAASSNPIGTPTGRYFTIGAAPWDASFARFQGEIDDVRIYAKEMQAEEIQYLSGLPAD